MKEQFKQTIKNLLLEQRNDILSFEKDPIEYIIQKYPSLDATLVDLLTEVYKDYITGIYVMAPKPTTFKILLHNGHSFYLIYHPRAYICKVSGKKYNLMDLKEEEYAIKAISNLLLLGIPPNSQGPDEEQTNENDFKGGSFASDMTSEPDLGDLEGDLDDLANTPDGEPGEGGDEEPEELQEQEEPKKELPKRFRIVKKNLKEIKINNPDEQLKKLWIDVEEKIYTIMRSDTAHARKILNYYNSKLIPSITSDKNLLHSFYNTNPSDPKGYNYIFSRLSPKEKSSFRILLKQFKQEYL